MTLVLIVEEGEKNQADWARVPELNKLVAKAHKLVADEFDAMEEVAILLTSNDHVQQLNMDFRTKDKPTNVLSFPDDSDDRLGDIAIAYKTVEQEALEANIPLSHHLSHLVIHGFLHLLGYDHIDQSEAEQMEALEIDLLAHLNIQNPYAV